VCWVVVLEYNGRGVPPQLSESTSSVSGTTPRVRYSPSWWYDTIARSYQKVLFYVRQMSALMVGFHVGWFYLCWQRRVIIFLFSFTFEYNRRLCYKYTWNYIIVWVTLICVIYDTTWSFEVWCKAGVIYDTTWSLEECNNTW